MNTIQDRLNKELSNINKAGLFKQERIIQSQQNAEIIVNVKEIQEPFNVTEFATNWTSIISSVVTTVILSRQLSGN